ncbi:hypothetical protein N7491_002654 [Penicillium cf. griseofulvum]|nr:hypothetical protein N7491_002654 [Penicillium cf. griseofulvum]
MPPAPAHRFWRLLPRKTTKMPDAPVLSDGKAVRFETWETIICQKLEANSDHYRCLFTGICTYKAVAKERLRYPLPRRIHYCMEEA